MTDKEKDFYGNYFEELRPYISAISEIKILIGKSPFASFNGTINLMIVNKKVEILFSEIKHDTYTELASIIYSFGHIPKSNSKLDCKSFPRESEIVVIKEKQDLFANKNFTFTNQDYEAKVIIKQSFSRCKTMK
ncbi:hypothetical protein NC653_003565 [Populus alba x Populus x berolinensis]|uniref:Uncharacterized protein n=1 Tax=Populus alba x Populus x berolinensis TaxID=444605 RepID=A0AAD6RRS7_9ROSI|nr:hypothetical protein NC653_003565 [Populus alba x Populus x berolinensis]